MRLSTALVNFLNKQLSAGFSMPLISSRNLLSLYLAAKIMYSTSPYPFPTCKIGQTVNNCNLLHFGNIFRLKIMTMKVEEEAEKLRARVLGKAMTGQTSALNYVSANRQCYLLGCWSPSRYVISITSWKGWHQLKTFVSPPLHGRSCCWWVLG